MSPATTLTFCLLCCLKTASVFNKLQFCQHQMKLTREKPEITLTLIDAKFRYADFRVPFLSAGEWETL